jgi:hypothetical protein
MDRGCQVVDRERIPQSPPWGGDQGRSEQIHSIPGSTAVKAGFKNGHLLRCAATLIAQRISIYASRFGFCAPCI